MMNGEHLGRERMRGCPSVNLLWGSEYESREEGVGVHAGNKGHNGSEHCSGYVTEYNQNL